MRTLSLPQARRIALAAQGFARPRPDRPDRRHLRRLVGHTGLLQIDSVNVLVRAHYLPGWSRLGGYSRDLLDRMTYRDRELFEYWGHEASLLPVALHPLLRWRMARARESFETWGRMAALARERPDYLRRVLGEVRDRGPLTASEVERVERSSGSWWSWSDPKLALEYLFRTGEVTAASRRGFERVYDLTERVLPAEVLAAPTPDEAQAHRRLLRLAARCHGVGTLGDLADYFRIRTPLARPRVAELVEAGELEQVQVAGWRQPAYLHPDAVLPRRVDARALLAPFDPLVWERDRVQRLFGFRYRIEIYVPAAQRVHGYYVLPFLLGEQLVARVDLKSDRSAALLRVRGVHVEPGADAGEVAAALAGELRGLAAWLGLRDVAVDPAAAGQAAALLRRALA